MSSEERWVQSGADGRVRCRWPGEHEDYTRYHDDEWGRVTAVDDRLFEKVCLEGFQAGLSWLTILRKRENFRMAFADFDPVAVARFDRTDIDRCLADAGIVRHRGKIESTINNAGRALALAEECGSLTAYFWSYEPSEREPQFGKPFDGPTPAVTATSTAISKDLKKRGWSFVGPTTIYAFMQAMGLVNDHMPECEWHEICEAERAAFVRPARTS